MLHVVHAGDILAPQDGQMNRILLVTAALALLLALSGCRHPFERADAEYERMQRQAAAVLAARADPHSLAAAALILQRHDRARALGLIGRAAGAEPDRADLAWLHARICAEVPTCDPLTIESRHAALDPDNGLVHFGAMGRAFRKEDQASMDAHLAAIAGARFISSYYTSLVSTLAEATIQANAMPMPEAVIGVAADMSGSGLPDILPVAKSCATERLSRPGVTQNCRSLARLLMESDTYLLEMIGVAIARRCWPEDSAEWLAAVEARRVYKFRSDALANLDVYADWNEATASELLMLYRAHGSEQQANLALLATRGIDANPPPDWQPKNP